MDGTDLNKKYLNGLLVKISKEPGDFNINLLNYNDHKPANDFLDSFASTIGN